MNIKIQQKTQVGKESDKTELTITGKISNKKDINTEKLEDFQKSLQKRGVEFWFALDENNEYGTFKISTGHNPNRAGRKRAHPINANITDLEIIILLASYSNKEIYEKILHISEAAYFRAKHRLKESVLYKAIEKDENLANIELLSKDAAKYVAKDGNVYYSSRFLL